MAAVADEVHGPSDAELITAVREGDVKAYGSLYERHVTSAYNLARQLSRSTAEADDLVSEAFARVLDTLRAGRGPDSAFRAYLLTSLRHVAYDKTRKDRKVELTEDVTTVSGVSTEKISEPFRDTAVAGLERSLAAKAFARLPERWQAVLWHTEIEGQSPAEVAPLLGLTPNGVSALAYRAREGLRQAYLQVHLAETTENRCRDSVHKLGAWTRGGLSKRETTQVETHLDECDRCRALAAELAEVNGALRIFVAPLVLGAGAAAGYLALTAGGGKAVAGTAAVAGVAASSSGGAAGAASSVPRQFVGVGASVAALAAALVIALTAANSPNLPNASAAPAPKPAQTQPQQQPPDNQPPPNNPATPPATTTPPAPPPQTTTPGTTPATPAPGQPTLQASGPSESITLVPGDGPVDLPITVRNTGNATSAPVTATLNLPPGVSAVGPGSSAGAIRHNARQIACPGGTGTVSCGTTGGLRPGQSVVLMFRVRAAAGTSGGTITGTVSAGGTMSVTVAVQVEVPPAQQPRDALTLSARQVNDQSPYWLWNWDFYPLLDITATNTGTSTEPVSIDVDRTGVLTETDPLAACTGVVHETRCHSLEALAPGESLHLQLRLYGFPPPNGHETVTVTAQLGDASQSVTVSIVDCPWALPLPPWNAPSGVTGRPPTTTTTTADRPTTTTTPPVTTTTTIATDPPTTATTTPEPPSWTTDPSTTTTTTDPCGAGGGSGNGPIHPGAACGIAN